MITKVLECDVQVAGGYRRPLPGYIREPLRELITECWAQNPKDRPPITEVVDRLVEAKDAQKPLTNGKSHGPQAATKKGCCACM